MMFHEAALIVGAGAVAGVMNAVVGAGTLVTFPTLLILGYPPVVANVSNNVGLFPGSVMAAIGYRSTLRGRGPVVLRLALAATIGGVTGAALLVLLPGSAFETIVPALLVLSAALAALQPRIAEAMALRRAARGAAHRATGSVGSTTMMLIGLTGVYGGYFGAAQGVILLVVLGFALGGPLNELNGVKNILGGTANLIAAILFIIVAEVDWAVVMLIAIGATVGGGLGGRYGRRLPSSVLRGLLVSIAVIAAIVRLVGR